MDYSKLKGTYDIPPLESDFYEMLEKCLVSAAGLYCYKKVSFPVIEYAALFTRSAGESSDIVVKKEMYQFEDLGHRLIALRPEGTASAVRLYLENGLSMQGYTARIFYSGPMFRAEKPQAGRYRQFTQFGCECIGDPSPAVDVELLSMNSGIFKTLGINDSTCYLNSIGCRNCRPVYLEKLREYFEGSLDKLCGDCRERYKTNILRVLDCKEESCRPLINNAPSGLSYLCGECREHFEAVQSGLSALGITYTIDEKLVRGLDYYNRTVFEFKSASLGTLSTISGGGRYDYLVKEMGGMDTPAAGFSMGMERLAMAVEKSAGRIKPDYNIPPDVYVAFIGPEYAADAIKLLALLRSRGVSAVTEYRYTSLKKHLKSSNSIKARFALFIGEEEIKSGRYTLRNLSTGEQKPVLPEEIEELVKS